MTDEVLNHPGELVKFIVPYSNNDGEYQGVVTEKDVDTKHGVYHCKYCLVHYIKMETIKLFCHTKITKQ